MDWGTITEKDSGDWIDAAVLIPVYREQEKDFVILTKRTNDVLHHKGQICFPGGTRNPEDASLWETALRETREEIGLEPSRVTLIKELRRQFTPTGFRVTPFLGSIEPPFFWVPNPVEIAEIFAVPFRHFSDRSNIQFERKTWEEREFLDPHILFNRHEIWGMTGRILCELFEINPASRGTALATARNGG